VTVTIGGFSEWLRGGGRVRYGDVDARGGIHEAAGACDYLATITGNSIGPGIASLEARQNTSSGISKQPQGPARVEVLLEIVPQRAVLQLHLFCKVLGEGVETYHAAL